MRSLLCSAALATALALAAPAAAHDASGAQALASALADQRRADDRARDDARNPGETLEFFRVEPGMTVIDYAPGGGWYTRILVPYLGPNGRYVGLNPDTAHTTSDRFDGFIAGLSESFPAELAEWGFADSNAAGYNTNELGEEWNGTVDRVLMVRMLHNLFRFGAMHNELTRIRALLKDDGLFGIVQHRAKPWASGDYANGHRGYLREQDVIGLVEAHGFELIGKSEINANPADTADWPQGVWTLPPTYALGDTDRARYSAIGESDRMTLLFRKR